jgi:AAA domain
MSSAASSVRPEQRFTSSNPCPVCGGHERQPRGEGKRCHGFISEDREWARCTREEHAGSAPFEERTRSYVHKLVGDCKCGVRHDLAVGSGRESREGRKGQRFRAVATYDYTDEHENLLYQVVRLEPKDFRQRRPDGAGGWVWKLEGVRRVLYRLPELLSVEPDELVLVCEGEKDADRARLMGFAATTNAGGAKKWRPEYAEPLRGRPAAIIPHNDKEGREHAEKVARSLYGKAASVKVVQLPGVPQDGGDLSDWSGAGGTADKLRRLMDETPEWRPPEERDDGRVLLGKVIRDGIEPPAVLVEDVLLEGKTHAIYGPSGFGKTYVLLWAALRVIERGAPVVIFDNENNVSIMAERLEQLGADPDQIDRLLHYHPFPELPTTEEGRQLYEARLDRIKPGLVGFDSWISFLASNGLDENSSNDISTFSAHYLQPARRRGITTLMLDHVPHDGNHARGSTRKRDEVDVMWSLGRLLPFDRDRVGTITLTRVKDREGWVPQSVTFSVGGDGKGGFVFARSAGTAEAEEEDGLKDSERKSLQALKTFGESGARAVEWQKTAAAVDVARRTFYGAKAALVSKGFVLQKKQRYFVAGAERCNVGALHQDAPTQGKGAEGAAAYRAAPSAPPGTSDSDEPLSSIVGPGERIPPEQLQQIRKLTQLGMREDLAREEVLGKGWVEP